MRSAHKLWNTIPLKIHQDRQPLFCRIFGFSLRIIRGGGTSIEPARNRPISKLSKKYDKCQQHCGSKQSCTARGWATPKAFCIADTQFSYAGRTEHALQLEEQSDRRTTGNYMHEESPSPPQVTISSSPYAQAISKRDLHALAPICTFLRIGTCNLSILKNSSMLEDDASTNPNQVQLLYTSPNC